MIDCPPSGFCIPNRIISIRLHITCMADRPDKNASTAEIAKWMEEDFWVACVDGIEESVADDDEGKE